ncbi:hypothetical protein RB2083_1146 [Rhodobacteraceae bacterium HTCC2083]|nr:hypothetical protein RB2083_1146 [Rhodobacteraceae bacterium HTCC2083]
MFWTQLRTRMLLQIWLECHDVGSSYGHVYGGDGMPLKVFKRN